MEYYYFLRCCGTSTESNPNDATEGEQNVPPQDVSVGVQDALPANVPAGVQDVPSQNTPLWYIDDFRLQALGK